MTLGLAGRYRRPLQIAVVIGGIVPVAAGLMGLLLGPQMVGQGDAVPDLDSHFRYLSGLLLGIGLGYWSLVPRIAEQGAAFRLLTAIVFVGGIGRLLGLALSPLPSAPMLFGLVMELVVTPLLCLWQMRVARAEGIASASAVSPP